MSLKDDLDVIDPSEEVQKAFNESGGTRERRPWTISRNSAAMSMGCRILAATDIQSVVGLLARGHYSNILRDVVIALWLCSIPDEEVIQINAGLDITKAITSAFQWSESEGLSYGSARFFEGVKLLDAEITRVYSSFYAIEGNKPDPIKKNGTPPLGKSGSPTTRRKPVVTRRPTV